MKSASAKKETLEDMSQESLQQLQSTLELTITIQNQSGYTMYIISDELETKAPKAIWNGENLSWKAPRGNDSIISNSCVYQFGPSNVDYQVCLGWYVQLTGRNYYNAEVQLNDGRFTASYQGGSGYQPHVTYIVTARLDN